MIWVALALAGGIGALARDRTGRWFERGRRSAASATTAVNLVGAFTLGVVVGALDDSTVRTIVGVGALGGFTTFSTWMSQVAHAPARRQVALVLGPLVSGVSLAAVGLWLGGYA